MSIRELIKEDIPKLVEMAFLYKQSQNPNFEESRKQVIAETFQGVFSQPNTKALICLNPQGLITGYILFHLLYCPIIGGKEIYVSDLFINENERGKGIGSSLIAKAEHFARENQCVRLMLNNLKESEGYRRDFYKKQGFTERTAIANYVKLLKE